MLWLFLSTTVRAHSSAAGNLHPEGLNVGKTRLLLERNQQSKDQLIQKREVSFAGSWCKLQISGSNSAHKEMKNEEEKPKGEVVHLRREIGLLSAVSFIIGTVVGSGIFIAPKGVLMNSGSVGLSLLVWALSGVLSLFGKMMDDVIYVYSQDLTISKSQNVT